ncbi:hypothetical protein [Bradyrhizobium genomosp. I (2014)]|uniref:hypothetical protein n=1 Tax=Bradyrhizobium genomosp. I (2014) TaxID=2683269 RepID=UPI001FCB5D9F|nr:hypothetical protein [Bradyrhizobium sp. CCBAU 43298]
MLLRGTARVNQDGVAGDTRPIVIESGGSYTIPLTSWSVYLLSRHVRTATTHQHKALGRPMKRLKNSLAEAGNPTCPNCRVDMRWFRPELVRDTPSTMIAHLFVCPNCKRAQRQDTEFAPVVVPPDKLASSRFQVVVRGKQAI